MDAVTLPNRYTRTECQDSELPGVIRCWRTHLMPDEALPDLRNAVERTGAELVEPIPIGSADTPRGPAGTSVQAALPGTYDFQGFVLLAQRDVNRHATAQTEIWLQTTTVLLHPVLTAP